jgi:hypothetical protein
MKAYNESFYKSTNDSSEFATFPLLQHNEECTGPSRAAVQTPNYRNYPNLSLHIFSLCSVTCALSRKLAVTCRYANILVNYLNLFHVQLRYFC